MLIWPKLRKTSELCNLHHDSLADAIILNKKPFVPSLIDTLCVEVEIEKP